MIISHEHRFIFLKPRKVAGTSVEVTLSEHCGDEDIVTPIGEYDPRWDEDPYEHSGEKHAGYSRHANLKSVRRQLGEELWKRYFKFSIVRNPWDLVVSQYHWATRRKVVHRSWGQILWRFVRRPGRLRRNLLVLGSRLGLGLRGKKDLTFDFFATYLLRYYEPNDWHYFDDTGTVGLDYLIRFERLQEDYDEVCRRIGIPSTELPVLKSKTRPDRHYSEYYTEKTRGRVARFYWRHLEHFGYTFEEA